MNNTLHKQLLETISRLELELFLQKQDAEEAQTAHGFRNGDELLRSLWDLCEKRRQNEQEYHALDERIQAHGANSLTNEEFEKVLWLFGQRKELKQSILATVNIAYTFTFIDAEGNLR